MQLVPVNVFRTPDRLTVVAPMPGMLPEDISITVTTENLPDIKGARRGVPAGVQVFHHPAPARRGSAPPRIVEEVRDRSHRADTGGVPGAASASAVKDIR
jgi:HSP20 family molecular chaperone IbpA